MKQLGAKEIGAATQSHRHDHRQDHAVDKHPVHTLFLPGSVVLAGEAHARLRDGIDRYEQESEDVVRRRVSRHGNGSEGIHRRLQQYVGKIDHHALNSCRHSHLEDLHQILPFDSQLCDLQTIAAVRAKQTFQYQHTGDDLREHRSDGHTCHSHGKDNDQEQIQCCVNSS